MYRSRLKERDDKKKSCRTTKQERHSARPIYPIKPAKANKANKANWDDCRHPYLKHGLCDLCGKDTIGE